MSLEPGGYADKLGNRYEVRWAVRQLLMLLLERLSTVEIEVVGDEERGVDLWIQKRDGVRVAQQCKIRNTNKNSWTVADLASRGIIDSVKLHLDASETNRFEFVTPIPSTTLNDLCTSARNSKGDSEEFYLHQVQNVSQLRLTVFKDFCKRIGLDPEVEIDRNTAYSYLKRFSIEVRTDGESEKNDLAALAELLVVENAQVTIAVLAEFAQDSIRKKLTAADVWDNLKSHGIYVRELLNDDRVVPSIKKLQEQFSSSIEPHLINSSLIPREETGDVLKSLENSTVVALHGAPGNGKSGVLFELFQKFEADGTVCLPIRLDRQLPAKNTRVFGKNLGLPESPVRCLKAMAGDRSCVLLIDQLDALRWTSSHSIEALEVCKELFREVRGYQQIGVDIRVVLACRSYDIKNDPEIKNLIREMKNQSTQMSEIILRELSENEVNTAIHKAGIANPRLSNYQYQILRSPHHLSMWIEIVKSDGIASFQNSVHLMRSFWDLRIQEIMQNGTSQAGIDRTLGTLVDYMELNSSLTAPKSLLRQDELDPFLAAGVIDISESAVSFRHQSYLDFQIASRIVREIHTNNITMLQWVKLLGSTTNYSRKGWRSRLAGWLRRKPTWKGQTLFHREQLHQALSLLSVENSQEFQMCIDELLDSKMVRFHMKRVCLEVVGQVQTPTPSLVKMVMERFGSQVWAEHVTNTVLLGHAPFVNALIDRGVILEWIEGNDQQQSLSLQLLGSVVEQIPDEVASVLEPFIEDAEWHQKLLNVLSWKPHKDSEQIFSLRLKLARAGMYMGYVDWDQLHLDKRLPLLYAILCSMTSENFDKMRRNDSRQSRFDHWSDDDHKALLESIDANAHQAWPLLIEQIRRLAQEKKENLYRGHPWLDSDSDCFRQGIENLPTSLVVMAIRAGTIIAEGSCDDFWTLTASMRQEESRVIENILAKVYTNLHADYADRVVDWLLEDTGRFELGTGYSEPKWGPAKQIIESHSLHCSDEVFSKLEDAIHRFHSPKELENAKYWLSTWKSNYFGDYWGRCQYFLLPALAESRRSQDSTSLIGVLSRKYEKYTDEKFTRYSRVTGGIVGSTLNDNGLLISDQSWLTIITNTNVPDDGNTKWLQVSHDRIAESSIRQFASSLGQAAKRDPERFANLSLHFPLDVNEQYVSSILGAIKMTTPTGIPDEEQAQWVPATTGLVEKVLDRYQAGTSRELAVEFCRLIHERAEESWSDIVLDRVVNFALNHTDPEVEPLQSKTKTDPRSTQTVLDSLETEALNCVRGVAGRTIGQLIRYHPELYDRLKPAIEGLCKDEHPAVRTAGIEAGLYILNAHTDSAIECFVLACAGGIRVPATRYAVYYFNQGMKDHSELLAQIVRRMLQSDSDDVVEAGAREVAARQILGGHYPQEFKKCLAGSKPMRLGIAKVASWFVCDPEHFDTSAPIVRKLVNDQDSNIRSAAFKCIDSTDLLSNKNGRHLIRQCIKSTAFRDESTLLLHNLDSQTGDLVCYADIIFDSAMQFTGPLLSNSRDYSTRSPLDVGRINRLLMRLYEQANEMGNVRIANKCLDIWDLMFEKQVGGFQDIAC